MKNKISIIGTVGLPAKYGGFEALTNYLTQFLNEKNDLTVYCSSKSYKKEIDYHNGAKLRYIPLHANGAQSIPYDIISIIMSLRHDDTLLILGVSGCIALPLIRLFSKKRIIVNIDGLEWKREKWNMLIKSFLKLSEKLAVKYADAVITDNKVIQDYVKSEYSKESTLIAYGADHVQKAEISQSIKDKYDVLQQRYAFTVCRIEPENNLHITLETLAKQPHLPVLIIGNWDASQYGVDLRKKYTDYEHIHLLNTVYVQKILDQFRSNYFVYLHGHSAGGTNLSLVEAMFLGLPVFAYSANYNKETTEHKAQYFSNTDELSGLCNKLAVCL